MNVYFSDFYGISPKTIEDYGAFNVSLINDLPLFVDPFLLFNSDKPEYQALHEEILNYMSFLREMSEESGISLGLLCNWFLFPEVKQNWLGFSESGNSGTGLGMDFAKALNKNLNQLFRNFGDETITASSHLEKLCLIKEGVGRDNISDFTTNLIKGFLLDYTQAFALKHINEKQRAIFAIEKVRFDYDKRCWVSAKYTLPALEEDFVLLTPRDILTKDDTWINKSDMVKDFRDIVSSVSNEQLRAQINQYFAMNLPRRRKAKGKGFKQPTQKEFRETVSKTFGEFPELIDYFIRHKEDTGDQAVFVSDSRVEQVRKLFIIELSALIKKLNATTGFYSIAVDTLEESYQRAIFLKDVVENKDGYRVFYVDGEPIKRETDLHIMYRLTWYASPSAVIREANEGRGPVDFRISRGSKDNAIVEFKLASNTKLKQNLINQIEVYKKAHNTKKALKVIFFFSAEEEAKVHGILSALGMEKDKYIVLIDARNDNKPSASNA